MEGYNYSVFVDGLVKSGRLEVHSETEFEIILTSKPPDATAFPPIKKQVYRSPAEFIEVNALFFQKLPVNLLSPPPESEEKGRQGVDERFNDLSRKHQEQYEKFVIDIRSSLEAEKQQFQRDLESIRDDMKVQLGGLVQDSKKKHEEIKNEVINQAKKELQDTQMWFQIMAGVVIVLIFSGLYAILLELVDMKVRVSILKWQESGHISKMVDE